MPVEIYLAIAIVVGIVVAMVMKIVVIMISRCIMDVEIHLCAWIQGKCAFSHIQVCS